MGSSKGVSRPQANVVTRRPSSNVNVLKAASREEYNDTEEVKVVQEEGIGKSAVVGVNNTTKQVDEQQKLFYSDGRAGQSRLLPQRVAFDTPKTFQVGWIDNSKKKFICHSCYAKGHIAPQFQLKLYKLDQMIKDFEVLNEEERQTVPDITYNNAKKCLTIEEIHANKVEGETRVESKNT